MLRQIGAKRNQIAGLTCRLSARDFARNVGRNRIGTNPPSDTKVQKMDTSNSDAGDMITWE